MPFDIGDFKTELKPIDKLIDALRGPEPKWWDFGECDTCALHTAVTIGLICMEDFDEISAALSIGIDAAGRIFGDIQRHENLYGITRNCIRPRHVASSLEHFRDTREVLPPFHFALAERGA